MTANKSVGQWTTESQYVVTVGIVTDVANSMIFGAKFTKFVLGD